jgi:hypothetical protein
MTSWVLDNSEKHAIFASIEVLEGRNKIEIGLRKHNLKSPDCMVPVLAAINHYEKSTFRLSISRSIDEDWRTE